MPGSPFRSEKERYVLIFIFQSLKKSARLTLDGKGTDIRNVPNFHPASLKLLSGRKRLKIHPMKTALTRRIYDSDRPVVTPLSCRILQRFACLLLLRLFRFPSGFASFALISSPADACSNVSRSKLNKALVMVLFPEGIVILFHPSPFLVSAYLPLLPFTVTVSYLHLANLARGFF
jgi:hypothetical protein